MTDQLAGGDRRRRARRRGDPPRCRGAGPPPSRRGAASGRSADRRAGRPDLGADRRPDPPCGERPRSLRADGQSARGRDQLGHRQARAAGAERLARRPGITAGVRRRPILRPPRNRSLSPSRRSRQLSRRPRHRPRTAQPPATPAVRIPGVYTDIVGAPPPPPPAWAPAPVPARSPLSATRHETVAGPPQPTPEAAAAAAAGTGFGSGYGNIDATSPRVRRLPEAAEPEQVDPALDRARQLADAGVDRETIIGVLRLSGDRRIPYPIVEQRVRRTLSRRPGAQPSSTSREASR